MLALVAGFFLVCYLLAPGAIYRLAFSFFIPSKRFQRSRTEEIVFSVVAVMGPFLLAWAILCHTKVARDDALHHAIFHDQVMRGKTRIDFHAQGFGLLAQPFAKV